MPAWQAITREDRELSAAETKRAIANRKEAEKASSTVNKVILRGQKDLRITSIEVADRKFIKDLIDYLRSNKDSWSVNIFELQERAIFICSLFIYIENCNFKAQVEILEESKIKPFNNGAIFTDKLYKLLVGRRNTLEQKKIIIAVTLLFLPNSLSKLIIEYSGFNIVKDTLIKQKMTRQQPTYFERWFLCRSCPKIYQELPQNELLKLGKVNHDSVRH
jgi:hypothetical protein